MKLFCALLACGLALQAQPWDALHGLRPGEKIKVKDTSRGEQQGTFQSVSERSLTLATRQGLLEIERPRIARVQVRASSRRVRNLLIGAAIGVGVGIAVDQSVGRYLRNEGHDQYRALTYVAPIALFTGIGAALPAYRTVYRAR